MLTESRPPSKRYVESLQARIKVLEDQLADCHQIAPPEPIEEASSDSDEDSGEFSYVSDSGARPSSENREADFIRELTNTLGRMALGDDGELRYFGSQSNFNLLEGFKDTQNTQDLSSARDQGMSTLTGLGLIIDIPLELQKHLIELYFRWQNPWVYLIEKELFMEDFRSNDRTRYCTNLLLLAIFSVAARYSDERAARSNPDDPGTAGDGFAEQAKLLLLYECEAATITTVQAAALLSLRGMAENKEPAGWLYIGMATRMSFNLGLNLDCNKMLDAGLITEEEADLRKVVWWGCYTLDKLFCLGLGRVATANECDITCPKPSLSVSAELEPWTSSTEREESLLGAHSRIASCARSMSDHLSIATQALDQLYAANGKLSRSEIDTIVSRTDVQLNIFWSSLPSYLRLPTSSRTPTLPHIYQLHFQYHVAQVLLHRPLIARSRSIAKGGRQTLAKDDINLKACRKSACEIVRLLQIYKYHYSLRLITVGTISHTFTAAVIHLLDATSADAVIARQGADKLRICISALQEMGETWSWSYRARRALQILANVWLPQELRYPPTASNTDLLPEGQRQEDDAFGAISRDARDGDWLDQSALSFPDLPQPFYDDLGWLNNTGLHGLEMTNTIDPTAWASLEQTDPWLASVAEDTFTTIF